MYGYHRGLGLPQKQAAYASELTFYALNDCLKGVGIPLDKFVELAKIELFSVARTVTKHLKAMDNSIEKNASIAFLEKVFPDTYSPNTKTSHEHEFKQKGMKWEVEITKVKKKGQN